MVLHQAVLAAVVAAAFAVAGDSLSSLGAARDCAALGHCGRWLAAGY